MARYWGFWTRGKLDLLRRYLAAFTTASSSAPERLYLDVFGGQPENRDRLTNELLDGSARIALSTADPSFTRLRFFELEPHASSLRSALSSDFSGRDFDVVAGDSNATIGGALARLTHLNWAPTFAFVDPNGPDTHCSTLEALAEFKRAGSPKVEIWMLFAAGMFIRTLPVHGRPLQELDARRMTRMYGTEQWREVYEARLREELNPSEAREEYVNLMRWRLENVLGYRWTHPLEIFNENGVSIYHMIFASDHEVGNRIMTYLYRQAAQELPAMRAQARRLRREQELGLLSLFDQESDVADSAPVGAHEQLYEYAPPWPPRGAQEAT